MSRLAYIGPLLSAMGLAFGLVSQPAQGQKSEASRARVEHVAVRGTGDAMEVEIQTSGGLVAPDTQAITGPDRILVDFPGALPAAELHALELKVNSGALKSVRAGLFFNNPPITRVVLDLAEPQSYHIATNQNAVVVRLGPVKLGSITNSPATTMNGSAQVAPAKLVPANSVSANSGSTNSGSRHISSAKSSSSKAETVDTVPPHALNIAAILASQNASPNGGMKVTVAAAPIAATSAPPAKPSVSVTFANGMLRIHSEKATLAQVLYEVQTQTRAEIAIPAGAEQEEVISDLGPAPAREVLAALLNGSPYNFIFVGDELTLERVILTRREADIF
jgi:AMIN domain